LFLDIAIVIVIAIAFYSGFQRGLLPPLLAEAFFVLALLIVYRARGPFTGLLNHFLPDIAAIHVVVALLVALLAGLAGSRLGRALQRMPVVRGVDGFLGVFIHLGIAIVAMYVVISSLVAMDTAFAPLLRAATLTARQADALRHSLASNPLAALAMEPSETSRLERDSRSKQGAPIEHYPQLNQVQNVYLTVLRPQLHGSHLAPLVLRIGSRFPLFSHLGTASIPNQ
jgi:uncharacterized membrane protein required for colicin V production